MDEPKEGDFRVNERTNAQGEGPFLYLDQWKKPPSYSGYTTPRWVSHIRLRNRGEASKAGLAIQKFLANS